MRRIDRRPLIFQLHGDRGCKIVGEQQLVLSRVQLRKTACEVASHDGFKV